MNAIEVYEELSKLKDDPEAFDKRKEEIINEAIAKMSLHNQEKAEKINWCLEQELHHYKDPIARMDKMAEIF